MTSMPTRLLLTFFLTLVSQASTPRTAPVPSEAETLVKSDHVRFAAGTVGQGERFTPGQGRPGSWPGIVVVPDSTGINEELKRQCRWLASQGYLVLAVDLASGKQLVGSKQDHEKRALPSRADGVRQLQGAVSFLQNWMADPSKIGVVGWGTGAALAIHFAEAENNVKAVVANSGIVPSDEAALALLQAPVLANLGGLDQTTSANDAGALTMALRRHKRQIDIKIYPNAGHDFDQQDSTEYSEADAADANTRTRLFLAKLLKD